MSNICSTMSAVGGMVLFRTDVRIPSNTESGNGLVLIMKLTRRGKGVVRLFSFASVFVVIFAGFASVSSASSDVNTHQSSVSYVRVVVAPGETIWTVAAAVAGGRSVSSVVDDIVLINHLSSSDVAAGTRLLVPIK